MAPDEIARRLGWNLARVPGLVGINNHEGSRFTADARAGAGDGELGGAASVLFRFPHRAGQQAWRRRSAAGVMSAGRDIFLDDDQQPGGGRRRSWRCWRAQARRSGVAIAIGHPHDVTLKVLAAWLAQDHGVTLVPLDEAIRLKSQGGITVATR